MKNRDGRVVFLLCLVAFITLAPGYGAVVLDDIHDIVDNPALKGGILPAITDTTNPLRALTYITYWLNVKILPPLPALLHLANIMLHFAVGALVWALFRELKGGESGGAGGIVAAGLVLLNPFMGSSALYLSARSSLLVSIFTLSTLIGAVGYVKNGDKRCYVVACASVSAALLSKETGVLAPLLVAMLGITGVNRRRLVKICLPLFALAVIYVVARLDMRLDLGDRAAQNAGPARYLMTQFAVIPAYFARFFWPLNLSLQWDAGMKQYVDGAVICGALLLIGALSLSLYMARKNRLAMFFILWMPIALGPESSVVPLSDMAFDHRFYFPGAALALLLGLIIGGVWNRSVGDRRRLAVMGCVAAACFFALGFSRACRWSTSIGVWREAARVAPDKARPRYNLGYRLVDKGDIREGLLHLNAAVRLGDPFPPKQARSLNARGRTYLKMGKADEAVADLEAALKLDSTFGDAALHLGIAYIMQGRRDDAIEMLEYAKVLLPDEPKVDMALAKAGEAKALRRNGGSGTFPR